jgi:NAD-dependent deacetylase
MSEPSDSRCRSVAQLIADAKRVLVFTGAGVSVPSGIPDFRSNEGLWTKYPPEEFATIEVFHRYPKKFWELNHAILRDFKDVQPNPGHLALAKLEQLGVEVTVVTQNIDGLHQAAGSSKVFEIHGGKDKLKCLYCKSVYPLVDYRLVAGEVPKCLKCSAVLKPDIVYFGEALPTDVLENSLEAARRAKVCLAIGTSAVVMPAAMIPLVAHDSGAPVCEFNLESTGLTHSGKVAHFVEGSTEETLPILAEMVEEILAAELNETE